MDVVDLREFYHTALGQAACRLISARLRELTQAKTGQTVMGLGYTMPYLEEFVPSDALGLSFNMARQGVIHWPPDGPSRSALVDEDNLPLLESMVDIALVVHGLEFADAPLEMLHEIWRVMAPQGRLLLVVPNRRGVWAAAESSPFGHGRPFSRTQITDLLKEVRFSVTEWRTALFMPPVSRRTVLKAGPAIDQLGQRLMPGFAGVTIVEAMKQVYAFSSGKRARRALPRFRPVLLPSPQSVNREPGESK